MTKPRVIVTRRWPEEVENKLRDLFDVRLNQDDIPMSVDELKEAMRSADALCPTVTDAITEEVLSVAGSSVKIVSNYGVGYNNIDTKAARSANLVVTNTPEVLTDCTADLAMTLMLMAARRAGEGERHVRSNSWTGWRPTHMTGHKVTGKVLGLVGFGRIAQAMARKAHFGFGMQIQFIDPYPPSDDVIHSFGARQCDSLQDLLETSDFVAIHCPGIPENRHLISHDQLAAMKSSAILINTARGDIVSEAALVQALKTQQIAAAGLDVFEYEPKVSEELTEMDNVVLLPHLGSATLETRVAMGMRVIDNLQQYFAGKEPQDRVA